VDLTGDEAAGRTAAVRGMETGRAKETGRLTATERAEVVGTVRAVASTGTRLVVPSIAIAVAAKRDVRDMGVILGAGGVGVFEL
jgi:hypothetical protein